MKTASIQNLRHYYLSTGILRFLNSYILSDNKSYLLRAFQMKLKIIVNGLFAR